MKISVIGLGNWGTALANHLAVQGYAVRGWCRNADVVHSINDEHRNSKYLSHIDLSPSLQATTELDAVCDAEAIVLVIPSASLGQVLPRMHINTGTVIISGIKGIESESVRTPLDCIQEHLAADARVAVLSGPGFAKDIAIQRPAGLVVASHDGAAGQVVADLFASDWMKVYVSDDPLGVELGGIVKNVVAIAAGVSDGLGLGDSARAGLITRGLAEMMRLARAMGAKEQTLAGLSGLGDLVLTATCDASRNRTVGLRLGRGESLEHIVATLGSVAEGVTTTPLVLELARRAQVDMPITLHVEKLLKGEITAAEMLTGLISRPVTREFT